MNITRKESYLATCHFIEDYYYKPGLGYVGCMLGDIGLMSDGSSGDPAAVEDWNKSRVVVTKNKTRPEGRLGKNETHLTDEGNNGIILTEKQAYLIMIDFLEDYNSRINEVEIKQIIDSLKSALNGGPDSSQILENWHQSIIKAKDICAHPEND